MEDSEDSLPFLIMFPKMAISSYDREDQIGAGSACGAAIGANNLCCSAARKKGGGNKLIPNMTDSEDDYQMCYIINKINDVFKEKMSTLPTESNPLKVNDRLLYLKKRTKLERPCSTRSYRRMDGVEIYRNCRS